jgi:hypothetical protein
MLSKFVVSLVVVFVYTLIDTFEAKLLQAQRTDQQKQTQECVTPDLRTTSSSYSPMSRGAELEFRAIRRWCLRYGYADAIFRFYRRPQVLTLCLEPCLPCDVGPLGNEPCDLAAVIARRSFNVEQASRLTPRQKTDSVAFEKHCVRTLS